MGRGTWGMRLCLRDPLRENTFQGRLVLPPERAHGVALRFRMLGPVAARHDLVHGLVRVRHARAGPPKPISGDHEHVVRRVCRLERPTAHRQVQARILADGGNIHLQQVGEARAFDDPDKVPKGVMPRLDWVRVGGPVGEHALPCAVC